MDPGLEALRALAKARQATGDMVRFALEPGACQNCRRLLAHPDGRPRRFSRRTLEKNGSNEARPQARWRATLPPLHPHCRCALVPV